MDRSEFDTLKRGDIVRRKHRDDSYVVTANYGGRVTAAGTVDMTNPDEWDLLVKVCYVGGSVASPLLHTNPHSPRGVIARPFDSVRRKSTDKLMTVATRAAHERRWGSNATRHAPNKVYVLFDYGVDWVDVSDLESRGGLPIIGYEDDQIGGEGYEHRAHREG